MKVYLMGMQPKDAKLKEALIKKLEKYSAKNKLVASMDLNLRVAGRDVKGRFGRSRGDVTFRIDSMDLAKKPEAEKKKAPAKKKAAAKKPAAKKKAAAKKPAAKKKAAAKKPAAKKPAAATGGDK